MADPQQPGESDPVLERVRELRHDLGKYLVLPIGMLPADASPTQLREALATALLRTRRSAQGVVTARELWERFDAEFGSRLVRSESYAPLQAAVRRALQWEAALGAAGRELGRARLLHEMRAVRDAIDALAEELGDD